MITAPDFLVNNEMKNRAHNVTVVGAGGTGSAVMSRLFSMHQLLVKLGGVGLNVTLYDDDHVATPNIGRQGFYEFDLGDNKAEVLINRFNNFGQTNWTAVPRRFCTNALLSSQGETVFGCVDNVQSRKQIHELFRNSDTPIIYIDCGNDANSGQIVLGMNASIKGTDQYLPTVYDLFKTQLDTAKTSPSDSCSHEDAIKKQDFGINDAMAGPATQMLWRLVRHGKLEYQGLDINIKTGTTTPIPPDPAIWRMYGYEPKDSNQDELV